MRGNAGSGSCSTPARAATPCATRRAWSGAGKIVRVELGANGVWQDAVVEERHGRHDWQRWTALWDARPGAHELACRATDETGERQPLEPPWDLSGFGNNGVKRVVVDVTELP